MKKSIFSTCLMVSIFVVGGATATAQNEVKAPTVVKKEVSPTAKRMDAPKEVLIKKRVSEDKKAIAPKNKITKSAVAEPQKIKAVATPRKVVSRSATGQPVNEPKENK